MLSVRLLAARPATSLTKTLIVVVATLVACSNDEQSSMTTVAATTTTEAPTTPEAATTTKAPATTDAPTITTTAATIELAGREFVSTAVTGFEFVRGSQVTMRFDVPQIAISGGCNNLSAGPWSIEGDVLVVAEVIGEEMGCPGSGLEDQDVWVGALLTSEPTVAVDGDTLTLTAGQSSITLAEA